MFLFSAQFGTINWILIKVIKLAKPFKQSKYCLASLDCKMVIMLIFLNLSVFINFCIATLEYVFDIQGEVQRHSEGEICNYYHYLWLFPQQIIFIAISINFNIWIT